MMKHSKLPKPFEPLCDYEESESEDEELSVKSSTSSSENVCRSPTIQKSSEDTATLSNAGSTKKPPFKPLIKPTPSEIVEKTVEAETTTSSSVMPKSKSEINSKLRQLEMMKNAARKLNHEAVVKEDKDAKLPANWQALQKKNEWLLYEEEQKKMCTETGQDWDKVKLLTVQADEADRLISRKRRKNPDTGFASFEQASYRQYDRLTRQMVPDLTEYDAHKSEVGDEAESVNSMYHGTHKPSDLAVERMVGDLEKQIAKRAKFSRRRTFIEDRDVDYINERNAKFNTKIERFYGEYTSEIKQNLERGTAI